MSTRQFLRKDIAVFTSAVYQTNSLVLKSAEAVFIIDPCWLPDEVAAIESYVQEIKGHRKLYLIYTHSDYDHIIGHGAFPAAKVIASNAFHSKLDKANDIKLAKQWDEAHYISREYTVEYPDVDIVIDRDGKAIHFDGSVLTFYFAPGHTPEGMFIIWEPAGLFIAGDYLSDVEFPFIEDGMRSYRQSMMKVDRILNAHQIRWMVPGHGTAAEGRQAILRRRDESMEYLDDLDKAHSGIAFPTQKYQARYPYWQGLKDTHDNQLAKPRP